MAGEPPPKQRPLYQQAAMQIVAGGSAGLVEVCLMHPLDLVKTRFQIQSSTDVNRYTSIADCFKRMYRTEGALSFYKGILPPIFAETPKRATKFFTFEQYKKVFLFGASSPTALTFTLAGLFAGLTEAVVINPFEVVKIRLQAQRTTFKEQPSTVATFKEIIKENGFGRRGLNKGLTSTLGRHGVFNCVYFSFYHNVKGMLPPLEDPNADLGRRFLIGFTAGTLASFTNIPWDVAKSRIQGPQPVPGQVKYRTCAQTMALVVKEEGFFALYKGILPKVMRLGPGGAIMLIVFETVYEKLQVAFPVR